MLRFLTLGLCTRVPSYVFQHMAYAPLSRLMPANTSTAFVLWCSVFQHLAYDPLFRVARQHFNNLCVCSVVLCFQTLALFCGFVFSNTCRTPPCPVLCPLILQLLLLCGVVFSNTWRTPPCPVLPANTATTFVFALLSYVVQHLAYAPLSRVMPAITRIA